MSDKFEEFFENVGPQYLDCSELAKEEITLHINGKELMQLINGLTVLHQISKEEDLRVCEDCREAADSLAYTLQYKLDEIIKE